MANKYYEPGERRSALVQDLFAAVAKRYDLVNDLQSFGMHRCWKRRLIQLARVRPGERALDLCSGTAQSPMDSRRRDQDSIFRGQF